MLVVNRGEMGQYSGVGGGSLQGGLVCLGG